MSWSDDKKRQVSILVQYNWPFAIWIAVASCHEWLPIIGSLHCPIKALLGSCFGCGLTHQLEHLLHGKVAEGGFIYLILAGFVVNAWFSSVVSGRKCPRRP